MIRCKVDWKKLKNWERKALREALEFAEVQALEVLGYTIIQNDTAANWLRIGGIGYAENYEHLLTEEEKEKGKYVDAVPHGNVVLWIAR